MNIKLTSFECADCGNQRKAYISSSKDEDTLRCPECYKEQVNSFSDASGGVVTITRVDQGLRTIDVTPEAQK